MKETREKRIRRLRESVKDKLRKLWGPDFYDWLKENYPFMWALFSYSNDEYVERNLREFLKRLYQELGE